MKISIEDIVAKVHELDGVLEGSGWKRDGRIDFRFDDDNYRVELCVYEKGDVED